MFVQEQTCPSLEGGLVILMFVVNDLLGDWELSSSHGQKDILQRAIGRYKNSPPPQKKNKRGLLLTLMKRIILTLIGFLFWPLSRILAWAYYAINHLWSVVEEERVQLRFYKNKHYFLCAKKLVPYQLNQGNILSCLISLFLFSTLRSVNLPNFRIFLQFVLLTTITKSAISLHSANIEWKGVLHSMRQ